MSKMKDAMEGIEESSQKIDDILKVIEGVVAESGQFLLTPDQLAELAPPPRDCKPEHAAQYDRDSDTLHDASLAEITSALHAIVDDVEKVSDHVEGGARVQRRRAPARH